MGNAIPQQVAEGSFIYIKKIQLNNPQGTNQ